MLARRPASKESSIVRSVVLALAVSLLLSLLAVPLTPAPTTAATDRCFVSRADTTYRLAPQAGVVHVVIDFRAQNRCDRLNAWRFGWIPVYAEKVRFRGSGVSGKPEVRDGQWRSYYVSFPIVGPGRWYRWKVTYSLPTGRPGMFNKLALGEDYGHLCWVGHTADAGSTKLILPRRSRPLTYVGSASTKRGRDNVVVSAKGKGKPYAQVLCTDIYLASTTTQRFVSPGGTPIKIQGFADDPTWSDRVRTGVESTVPRLEELFGSPASKGDGITIHEVPEEGLAGYGGFNHADGLIRLGEYSDVTTIVAHEIAHQWSDSDNFAEKWLLEGYATWAANEVAPLTDKRYCYEPGDYPGKSGPRLSKWVMLDPRHVERDSKIVAYQYAAACHILTRLGSAMGDERMVEVIRTLMDGRSPYGGSARSREQHRKPADWREWLDAVDEVGLVPAGIEDLRQAEAFVTEFGIARKKALSGRASARKRYHELLAGQADVAAPVILRDQMDAWRFKDARKTMAIAESIGPRIAAALAAAESSAPEETAALSELVRRYEGAATLKALRRVRADVQRLPVPPIDADPV